MQYAFESDTLLFGAQAIVVIAADLERQGGKYSNRGYRYTLLEAGHVAQNIHLASSECDISTLEYGGFLDDVLAKELQFPSPQIRPLVTIALGVPSSEPAFNAMHALEDLESILVGPSKPVRYVRMSTGGEPEKGETFFGAAALYKPSPYQDAKRSYKERFAGGTATSSGLAQLKALAEAYERYASGLVRVDVVASASSLSCRWLDPRIIAPMIQEQFDRMPYLQEFNPDTSWEWVKGFDLTNHEEVLVPVDLVFYPLSNQTFNRKLAHEASSSGVAAYTTKNEAVQRAMLELIERDAIMRNWYARMSPMQINIDLLPYHWRRRVEYWRSQGREVYVLDLSQHGVVTINVVIMSNDYFPCFVNGSASSSTSFSEAVSKAFHEAELGLIHALRHRPHSPIRPEDVIHPMDHAKLYALPEHIDNLRWLWEGKVTDNIPSPNANLYSLARRFGAISVRLSPEDAPLYVARVLSEKLLTINFGYGTEHANHHTLREHDVHPASLDLPHYFA